MVKIRDKELLRLFGHQLRKVRTQRGMTQQALADESELWLSQVGRIERGEVNVTLSMIAVLARTLKVDLKELVDFELPPFENQQEH
ncbi:helix-turn-helix domain-containing protein [Larkinella punicea]|uniref:helix-turn-helix domain-containing protein n=1 Tax=Larkinella sp. GY13 TaxID=3453720 RepID=UPI0021CFBA62